MCVFVDTIITLIRLPVSVICIITIGSESNIIWSGSSVDFIIMSSTVAYNNDLGYRTILHTYVHELWPWPDFLELHNWLCVAELGDVDIWWLVLVCVWETLNSSTEGGIAVTLCYRSTLYCLSYVVISCDRRDWLETGDHRTYRI